VTLAEENVQLFESVIQLTSLPSRKQRETLLLFGLPGSGKTSIINTIYSELTGIDGAVASAGGGNAQFKTLDFTWYVAIIA